MQQFTGLEYIKIDLANQFGLANEVWDDRIKWTDTAIAQNKLMSYAADAEESLLYIKSVRAYNDAMAGNATGFIMGLDATASGLQVMAALSGCVKTATNVNLIGTARRENIYRKVADTMNIPGIDMKIVKKPVMTTFYGSLAQPKAVFGEGTPALDTFYQTLYQELPGAMNVMAAMQEGWQSSGLRHQWTLPDGHTASIKVMVALDKKIEIDELDHATFTHRAYVNMAEENGISLAANITHSVDGFVVREMLRMAKQQGFDLLSIHDSFWASPNFMQNVRENYRDILIGITKSNLLHTILQEITGGKVRYYKPQTGLAVAMTTAEYALS